MILGLAKRADDLPLSTTCVATGMYVIEDAYGGEYNYFGDTETRIAASDASNPILSDVSQVEPTTSKDRS